MFRAGCSNFRELPPGPHRSEHVEHVVCRRSPFFLFLFVSSAIPLALEFWATTQQAPSLASLDAADRPCYPLLISIHPSRGAAHPQMPWAPASQGFSRGPERTYSMAQQGTHSSARPSPAQHSLLGAGTVRPPRARGHTAFLVLCHSPRWRPPSVSPPLCPRA